MTLPPVRVILVPLIGVILAGCAAKPEYPPLVPMQDILQRSTSRSVDPAPDLQARAAALDTRADALRRTAP
ncbi:MAG TPA: hypothetical protein VGC40_08225 [Paenirhodobacter sp.]